ncbi:SNF1-interacting protein [Ceratobasidium sp. 395]|nr:SNF1-interacting protein [Ceratobasidium sp. 395]
MGNTASSSGKHSQSHNIRDETVDFGHLSPQGIYTGPQDWNQQVVGKLIVDRKLAPFYRPLEDYEPDWDDETILRNRKVKPGEEALPPPVTMQVFGPTPTSGKTSTKGKGVADRREPAKMAEAEVYRGATECPICFMAICTECFVQIKRSEPTTTHLVSEPAACPYCVQENFGVTYEPPSWRSGLVMNTSSSSRPELSRLTGSAVSSGLADSQGHLTSERTRRKSVPHQAGEVVTIDLIRPDWEAKLEAVRAAVTRRANRRIVMRQVGDRLIPVGITSGRVVPVNMAGGEVGDPSGGSGRRSRRQRNGASGELPIGMTGHDLEELMMMEAMRLSLLEHEAQQQREREAAARNAASNPGASSPPRGTSNASPDPASQLPRDVLQSQAEDPDSSPAIAVTDAPRSGSNTPLDVNPSRASQPGSDNSSVVSPRPSFDTSQSAPSHHRTGSGPVHVASSPLNSAAALAMAVGFPTPPNQFGTPSEPAELVQPGFPPRTLNTLSTVVSASSVPAAILGAAAIDRSATNTSAAGDHAPLQEGTNSSQGELSPGVLSSSGAAPSIEQQPESALVAPATPPFEADGTPNTVGQSNELPSTTQSPASPAVPASKPTVDSISSLPNPFDSPAVRFTVDDVSANSPLVSVGSGVGGQSSANFLSPAARSITADSIMSEDSHRYKGDSYDMLLSSPETETDEPLMSGPPNLARLDTMDSFSAQASTSGPTAPQ